MTPLRCCIALRLWLQSHVQRAGLAYQPEDISTVVIDEVHTRSVQSDWTLNLILLAMQASDKISSCDNECHWRP